MLLREHAVIIDVVVTTRDEFDALPDQLVLEMSVECWSCHALRPIADPFVVPVSVFGQRNVNERHVQMLVGVFAVCVLEPFSSVLEP